MHFIRLTALLLTISFAVLWKCTEEDAKKARIHTELIRDNPGLERDYSPTGEPLSLEQKLQKSKESFYQKR